MGAVPGRYIVYKSHSTRRAWRRLLCFASVLATGLLGGCLATLQQELEVLFASDAMENALLIPQSIVYNVFGELIFSIFELR